MPAIASATCTHRPAKIRWDWKHVSLLGLCLYLSGFVTGSFVCSVIILSKQNPAHPWSREGTTGTSGSMAGTRIAIHSHRQSKQDEESHEAGIQSRLFQARLSPSTASSSRRRTQLKPQDLKLPTPILVMGMMKAGTTSIYAYFHCGLDPETSRLSHYDCNPVDANNPSQRIGMTCGKRMRRNLTKYGKSAFDAMDNFTLYAELDAQEKNGGMTLPQWSYLDAIYHQFPNATWVLNWREPTKWLDSVNRWKDLRQRFVDNPFPPILPRGVGKEDSDMIRFYEGQAQRIRDFCRDHPSLSLVELPIDSPDAGTILEEAFGIPKSCWGQRNVNNGEAVWTVD